VPARDDQQRPPGTELSIGADTALNAIVSDVDKIKQSAVARTGCFVVEVMGHDCGYLALLGGLATGAERSTCRRRASRSAQLDRRTCRAHGRASAPASASASHPRRARGPVSTRPAFLHALFEKEGGDLFDVRQSILGHVQQGGTPSPFDRIQATRLAARCVTYLAEQAQCEAPASAFIGLEAGPSAAVNARFVTIRVDLHRGCVEHRARGETAGPSRSHRAPASSIGLWRSVRGLRRWIGSGKPPRDEEPQ
jgi:6-phosphofructokinase